LRKRRVGNELSILSPEIQEDLKYVKRTVDKKSPCATYLRDWLDFRRNLFVFLSSQRPKLVYPERLVVMFYPWIH